MAGNVWEWCLTMWRENYEGKPDDNSEGDALRVARGGSFLGSPWGVRCAIRSGFDPDVLLGGTGFRVVAFPLHS